ncbi:MAG: hypothetical protein ACR2J7_03400 [Luteimonas sp.]
MLFAALPAPQPVQAAIAVQRCTTADGGEIFTDKACSALGAETAPIPAPMMTRLMRTFSRDETDATAVAAAAATAAPRISRRAPSAGCARTTRQLEMDLRGALALGDVNRIAESYHWAGMTHRAGQQVMTRLESLAGQPVRDAHFFNAQIAAADFGSMYADASGAASQSAGDAGTLQLQLGSTSVTQVVDLSVERYAGCYFVRF